MTSEFLLLIRLGITHTGLWITILLLHSFPQPAYAPHLCTGPCAGCPQLLPALVNTCVLDGVRAYELRLERPRLKTRAGHRNRLVPSAETQLTAPGDNLWITL